MRKVLVLEGGVDVTPYIKSRGYTWTRNVLHSNKTTRTRDGRARVDKITDKVTLPFELGNVPAEKLSAINDVLKQQTFHATYYGVEGSKDAEFYCPSFSAKAAVISENQEIWENAAFTIIEV